MHAFLSHFADVSPHTSTAPPSPPNRGRVTRAGGIIHSPPSVGAGVAQSPTPPASTHTSPGKKQSRSVVHDGNHWLAKATQSSFTVQVVIGFSQRFRTG